MIQRTVNHIMLGQSIINGNFNYLETEIYAPLKNKIV